MATSKPQHSDELARLERKLNRERRAREEAERLLEEKSSQLFDANQRLEAEAKRARSLVTAIQSASDGIALTDADGLFVFMNKAHAAMFGYEVDELIGQSWSILYSAKELKRFDKQIMPDFGRYGFWSGETTGQAKTGDYVLQDIALTALPDGGLICATRDITKRRANLIRARELEQRLQKAEQEAALFTVGNAVAHDFNNLIGAISGYAVLIQRNLDEASEPFKYAERISQAADQAAGVIRSLELERINDTNTLDEVDLASLVRTGVSIAQAIRPPGITMDVDIPTSARVQANEVTLSRCLLNISKNAFEAMGEEGELLIRVTDSPTDPFDEQTAYVSLGEPSANYEWIIEICDTGTGIRQEKLDKIFEPFFTTKSTLKGSGLGLLSLTALVESGTAFIEVMSRLDYGTQFRLSFKAEGVEKNATPNSEPDMMPASSHDGQNPHVLVVEDEAMMGEVIASTLKNLGYSCELRHDPRKALALLEDDAYRVDLVLTDLTMPHIRGDDFSDRVKTLRADLPVIIYSGQAGYIKPDPKYAAILRKPIAAHDLDDAIQSALRG
ncbi:ATP-binding protein [Hyphomonas sp. FCG-A18]|uniref:hybrid sensor histidine kinase/response regulator n=1 Tax=Hyphomonas sp. FCG-A18 TaxID=3080019 RepID=UPI002B2D8588|nr:ATP-binding protein [Hyphomonas sp. FCG-A18]